MSNIAVLGTFFGDEAKARAVHWFAKDYDYIIRYSGANNCGHTIYHNGTKIVRHLIPAADFSIAKNKAFLGSGMVIDINALLSEVKETEAMFPGAASKIIVDPDAFIITAEHIADDKKNNAHIGSTGKGVGPAYRDKIARSGTRLRQLIIENNEVIIELKKIGVQFKYCLEMFNEFESSKLIFEGSQSILLDISYGCYPYCTSGECGISGIINSGFASLMPNKIYGAMKAYGTKVGAGPFPTELFESEAEKIQSLGKEVGATTGRTRRVGWLDLPALKYAAFKSGMTGLILCKLDIFNGFGDIKVCTSYEDGDLICGANLATAKPIYKNIRGWQDASDHRQISHFIDLIEDYVDLPVEYVSSGVGENDIRKWYEK